MATLFPLPEHKKLEALRFHEIGVLLDHMLHAQDLLAEKPPYVLDYFGEYLAASSFFRNDRALGWGDSGPDRTNYPTEITAEKPIPYIANKTHTLLRKVGIDFRKLMEKPEGYDDLGEELSQKIRLYRAFLKENFDMDPLDPELQSRMTEAQRDMLNFGGIIANIRAMLEPENLPEFILHVGDTIVTLSNLETLHPDLRESFPALGLFVSGYSGVAMVDRTKLPADYRDFMTGIVSNEADITFILDRVMQRAMEANSNLRVEDFPGVPVEEMMKPLQEGVHALEMLYHFHRTLGEATPESVEAIKRFHQFATSNYTENHTVPLTLNSQEEAGIILYALATRMQRDYHLNKIPTESLLEYAEGLCTGEMPRGNFKWPVEMRISYAEKIEDPALSEPAKALLAYFKQEKAAQPGR